MALLFLRITVGRILLTMASMVSFSEVELVEELRELLRAGFLIKHLSLQM
jgi:hypothetical protein